MSYRGIISSSEQHKLDTIHNVEKCLKIHKSLVEHRCLFCPSIAKFEPAKPKPFCFIMLAWGQITSKAAKIFLAHFRSCFLFLTIKWSLFSVSLLTNFALFWYLFVRRYMVYLWVLLIWHGVPNVVKLQECLNLYFFTNFCLSKYYFCRNSTRYIYHGAYLSRRVL